MVLILLLSISYTISKTVGQVFTHPIVIVIVWVNDILFQITALITLESLVLYISEYPRPEFYICELEMALEKHAR